VTPKNPAAVALGRRGGKARVQNQTAEQRKQSAQNAAAARWANKMDKVTGEIKDGVKELVKLNKSPRSKKAKEKKATK
jgi:hypothetical protein